MLLFTGVYLTFCGSLAFICVNIHVCGKNPFMELIRRYSCTVALLCYAGMVVLTWLYNGHNLVNGVLRRFIY